MEHEILTNSANTETNNEGKEVRENSYNSYKKKNNIKKVEAVKEDNSKVEISKVEIPKTEEAKEEAKIEISKTEEVKPQETKPVQITLPKKSKKKVLSVSPMHIVVEDKGSSVWIPGKFNVKVGDMVEV